MYGIIIVSHGSYAKGMVEASEMIIGDYGAEYAGLFPGSDLDYFEADVRDKIAYQLENHQELIVFTDLMGGTPFNIVSSMMEDFEFTHFTGVNLPILLEVVLSRDTKNLDQMTETIEKNKCKSIICVNKLGI